MTQMTAAYADNRGFNNGFPRIKPRIRENPRLYPRESALRESAFALRESASRWGQSTFEYAAVVAIVAAALLSMAIYVKRAISGRLRESADSVGEQYHPTQTVSNLNLVVNNTTTTTSQLLVDQNLGGIVANVMESNTNVDDNSNRTGTENVGAIGSSIWQ